MVDAEEGSPPCNARMQGDVASSRLPTPSRRNTGLFPLMGFPRFPAFTRSGVISPINFGHHNFYLFISPINFGHLPG